MYLESINLSKGNPTATIEFDIKGAKGVRKTRRTIGEKFNLFPNSGELAEYKNGYTVLRIDGRDSSIEFTNAHQLFAGDVFVRSARNSSAEFKSVDHSLHINVNAIVLLRH